MDGLEGGVNDAPVEELDSALDAGASEVDAVEDAALVAEDEAEAKPEADAKDDPYTTRFAREMRAALKAWEQANPEQAKYARQARDNHARLFALQQLEPGGIEGVREKYQALEAIGGPDGLTGLQERIRQSEEVDTLVASGDPKLWETMGPEANEGLSKLLPSYLARIQQFSPEAYSNAILPHVVATLAQSPLVTEFNGAVDELKWRLNGRQLNQLTEPEIRDIAQTAIRAITGVGTGLNQMGSKADEVKQAPVNQEKTQFEAERTQFEQERQKLHWDTKIAPSVVQHENAKFEELFKPYAQRLKLDATAKGKLMSSFKASMASIAGKDTAYTRQMGLYRGQKNPDPAAVTNFVKNAINKHAKNVFEQELKDRYGFFLKSPTRTSTQTAKPASPNTPAAPNVERRTVKPPMSEIDHRNTPVEWLSQRKYKLYSGKVIQVVKQ